LTDFFKVSGELRILFKQKRGESAADLAILNFNGITGPPRPPAPLSVRRAYRPKGIFYASGVLSRGIDAYAQG